VLKCSRSRRPRAGALKCWEQARGLDEMQRCWRPKSIFGDGFKIIKLRCEIKCGCLNPYAMHSTTFDLSKDARHKYFVAPNTLPRAKLDAIFNLSISIAMPTNHTKISITSDSSFMDRILPTRFFIHHTYPSIKHQGPDHLSARRQA
jgi:hypothetical protein